MADDTARHRPGTPCWVILVTPDPDRTGPFYAGLFGWSVPPAGAGFAIVESGHAQFGLWEAGTHPGAVVTGQVGSLTWAELRTRSRASAARFYEAVFGWEVQAVQSGAEVYITCLLDQVPVAGMVELGAADGRSPSFWMPYFAVEDCEAAASLADGLGGEVCAPPHDTGGLRLAVLRDPLGALFYVVEPQTLDGD